MHLPLNVGLKRTSEAHDGARNTEHTTRYRGKIIPILSQSNSDSPLFLSVWLAVPEISLMRWKAGKSL